MPCSSLASAWCRFRFSGTEVECVSVCVCVRCCRCCCCSVLCLVGYDAARSWLACAWFALRRVSFYHRYALPFLSSPFLSSLLPPSSPSLRAVSFASPFSALIACLLAIAPGVPCEELNLPDYYLLLDLSLPRSCILRLSLSVSACACPPPTIHILPCLVVCLVLGWSLCIVSFRFAPPCALRSMAAAIALAMATADTSSVQHQHRPPAPKCFIYTLGPAGREAIGRGSRTSLSAHHRLQLSPLRNHHRIAVSSGRRARTATIRRNTP